jgi:hypothetical protein
MTPSFWRAGSGALLALELLFGATAPAFPAAGWQAGLSNDPPGNFRELRPLHARYNFGWSGLTAANAEVHYTKADGRFQLDGSGRTAGLARALWKFDVKYQALSDAGTLRPIETTQNDHLRSKKMITHLAFRPGGVTRTRTEWPGPGKAKTKEYSFPNLYDLQSAMLYLRSQPLLDKSSYRVVVYPTTSAYLATVTVVGREKIAVRAGSFDAIKLDLQLSKVGKTLELEPHKKFRRATIWMSDDADRMILRAEAQIFVGTVFAELQSVRFDSARP